MRKRLPLTLHFPKCASKCLSKAITEQGVRRLSTERRVSTMPRRWRWTRLVLLLPILGCSSRFCSAKNERKLRQADAGEIHNSNNQCPKLIFERR